MRAHLERVHLRVHLANVAEGVGPLLHERIGLAGKFEVLQRLRKEQAALHRRLVDLNVISRGLSELP